MSQTRRSFIAASVASATPLVLGSSAAAARRSAEPLAAAGDFPLGVWSGQPGPRAITLGTKVDGLERASRLTLEVARDAGFANVVHRQEVRSAPVRGHAVKERLVTRRLAPGEQFFYRFATRTTSSPVGRFRTARPADSQEPLRIGFFSCQRYASGFYTAHRALAQEDLDLVVCLGDYIYETNGDDGLPGRADRTSPAESGQCETLDEYRAKYALYRSDPDLQAMHAAHAFVATWDDHEVENNQAGEHPGTTASRRIPYAERRRNAHHAFFEHMPMERVRSERDRVYRRVRLGGMVDLLMLDQRQYRDVQPCDDTPAVPCAEAADPSRTLLGERQRTWLKHGLERSTAAWKILGSSVEMMGWQYAPTLPLNFDGWDGYQAERADVLNHVLAKGIKDVTVLTGDIHHFVCGDVHVGGDRRTPAAATEFVGSSISSEAVQDYGVGSTEFLLANPHFRYMDLVNRGYGILEARPDELRVAFRSPATTKERTSPTRTLASFVVERGTPRVERT